MLLSPAPGGDGVTMMASGSVRLRAAPGGGLQGLHGVVGGGGGLPPLGFVSPLRLGVYERLHGLPGLPLDSALLSAAHQVK